MESTVEEQDEEEALFPLDDLNLGRVLWWDLDRKHRIHPSTDFPRMLSRKRRQLRKTRVGETCVSTVFLMLDHGIPRLGPPQLFETMLFGGPEELDMRCWRYPTYMTALKGHHAVVAWLRAAQPTTPRPWVKASKRRQHHAR